ncbi:MAG: cytochrome b/b6 domain-containing protein [Pseudomonadota bacterium]
MAAYSEHGYNGVARAFHWLTAFLIIILFLLGWYMADLEFTDPLKFSLYQVHKSIGITVFVLAVFRLLWRVTHKAPPWPDHMTSLERMAATGAHWALYGLILAQPLIGILQSNADNFPIVFWGQIQLPALIGPNEALGVLLAWLHYILALVLAFLILVHVAAALRHHIQIKDDVLRNMIPSPKLGMSVIALALIVTLPPFVLMRPSTPVASAGGTTAPEAAAEAIVEETEQDEALPEGLAWTIEEGSALGFVALQQGSEVLGGFDNFDATIIFDPDDLESSRIDVDIDVTSINTGQDSRDQTLNSASFFETATWPSAAFKSGKITATGEGQYEAAGTLTIRDVTKDVVLAFTLDIQADPADSSRSLADANGELPILRLDYGVGQGDWTSTTTVADEVVITIDIKASKANDGENPSG